jgi:hypothetical protein
MVCMELPVSKLHCCISRMRHCISLRWQTSLRPSTVYHRTASHCAAAAAQGMQDDARFAEMFVRGQWITKAQAPARIAYVSVCQDWVHELLPGSRALLPAPGAFDPAACHPPAQCAGRPSWSRRLQRRCCRACLGSRQVVRAQGNCASPKQHRHAWLGSAHLCSRTAGHR